MVFICNVGEWGIAYIALTRSTLWIDGYKKSRLGLQCSWAKLIMAQWLVTQTNSLEYCKHACFDGFSRIITCLLCATNNRWQKQNLVFLHMYVMIEEENVLIMKHMRSKQGYDGAYIQGPSLHNQRIERLYYDTTHCALSH